MKSAPFDYFRPNTLDEALKLLQEPDYRVVAGGQSLVPMMNFRLMSAKALVDLNDISALAAIHIDNDHINIGAMTRQRQIERHDGLKDKAPIFAQAIKEIGHRQTRNRGTIGGSLCQLDPSAELPLLCLLHDARITVQSLNGTRVITAHDFMRGAMDPYLLDGEIVTHIQMALWPPHHGYGFLEYARRAGDFAIGSAACLLTLTQDQTIDHIALCIGGLADVPKRLHHAEAHAQGHKVNIALIDKICEFIDDVDGHPTVQASVAFKKQITKTLVKRALIRAHECALHKETIHAKKN
jgi:aerobic carbon-monoxide dehydrogenase medium subunit